MDPPPSHHANSSKSSFRNPWPSATPPSISELLLNPFNPLGLAPSQPTLESHAHSRPLKVVTPTWKPASEDAQETEGTLLATWLGHASVLVEVPLSSRPGRSSSLKLLFDPIFSKRAGPSQWGPGRLLPAPCGVDDLPGVDVVLLSHNHYDHSDETSLVDLSTKYPSAKFYVPLGNTSMLLSMGIAEENIVELDWWDQTELLWNAQVGLTDDVDEYDSVTVRVSCVPAQHNSGRTVFDQMSSLWCGWVVESFATPSPPAVSPPPKQDRTSCVYFAGDTGYRRGPGSTEVCPAFKEIGERFGPIDLSLLPIWRGGSLGFVSGVLGLRIAHESIPSPFHASPADAVEIHLATKSLYTIAIHWGTFVGSEVESLEASIELNQARVAANIADLDDTGAGLGLLLGRLGLVDIGETKGIRLVGTKEDTGG